MEVEGKIIGILDSHTFVIDKGLLDGVRLKDFVFVCKEEIAEWGTKNVNKIVQKIPIKIMRVISVQKGISRVSTLLDRFETQSDIDFRSNSKKNIRFNRWNLDHRLEDLVYFNSLTRKINIGDTFFMKTETNPMEILI